MEILFLPLMILGAIGGLLLTAFWIWMVVDCARYESGQGPEKIIWLIVILALNWIGALIYFIFRRNPRTL